MKEKFGLEQAEQQILGFYHCYQGFDIKSLCSSMALTKKEYTKMVSSGMLHYLPKELGDEIIEYLSE